MTGPLVVEGEPRSLVAEGQRSSGEGDEAERRGNPSSRPGGRLVVGGMERVPREHVLQVGEQALLVLLFVVQPEHHHFPHLF